MDNVTDPSIHLNGSLDPALLTDLTMSHEHLQKRDGTVGFVEKASSGRMSPIRKKSVKDVEQQIEALEKENFDLKLRIYFLEQQSGVSNDDALKVNIDLKVQLQSIHQEFQTKQSQWEQMMSSYESHITELENEIAKSKKQTQNRRSQEVESLEEQLKQAKISLHEMENQLRDKAFESENELVSLTNELDQVRQQLADRERQINASPSQEDFLRIRKQLDQKDAELDKRDTLIRGVTKQSQDLQIQLKRETARLSQLEQQLSEKDHEISKKDATLRNTQVHIESLKAALVGKDAELEKTKAVMNEKFSQEHHDLMAKVEQYQKNASQKDAVLLSRDKEISAQRRDIHEKDITIKNMNNELNNLKREVQRLGELASQSRQALNDKEMQLQNITTEYEKLSDKYRNDIANLERKISQLLAEIRQKDEMILRTTEAGYPHQLEQLRAALAEKDKTVTSLLESSQQKDDMLKKLQEAKASDNTDNPAITRMCQEIELLKKENAALKEGRPINYDDDDLDLDGLSDTSETRDYLHTQLAKHNARSSALQSRLLELSREDVDGGSGSSSLLKEQVAALVRMREADKKVIDALKRHISINSDGTFKADVITDLAADVNRLSEKLHELQKKRSKRSGSSRSASHASSNSSVYKEEIDHLKKELDETRHEASKVKADLYKYKDESAIVAKLEATEQLVRQQADEKRQLSELLLYYKRLLEANGLLPSEEDIRKVLHVPEAATLHEKPQQPRVSKIPRRSLSSPRVSRERSLSADRNSTTPRSTHLGRPNVSSAEFEGHLEGLMFRQKHVTPNKVNEMLKRLSSGDGELTQQTQPDSIFETPEYKGLADDNHRLQSQIDQYRREVQAMGKPVELKKKLDDVTNELKVTQDKLDQSLEQTHELEISYQEEIREKDEYIEELQDRIRRLEAQLGLDSSHLGDLSGSITIPLSPPPSSLHSVPIERTSSRVVSLQDRSMDGEKSGRSFGASSVSLAKSTHSDIQLSPAKEDAGVMLITDPDPVEDKQSLHSMSFSHLKLPGNLDSNDSTTERLRHASQSIALDELPSLSGTYPVLQTQEDMINVSKESQQPTTHVRQLFAEPESEPQTLKSPEKGKVLSPSRKSSTSTVERYEKALSPDGKSPVKIRADTWEEAERLAFGPQFSPSSRQGGTGKHDVSGTIPEVEEREGPGSTTGSSRQTEEDICTELSGKLIDALSREEQLVTRRRDQMDLHKKYEKMMQRLEEENEDLRSQLSEVEADVDDQLKKRIETAQMVNELQDAVSEKNSVIEQLNQQYEEGMKAIHEQVSELGSKLTASQVELREMREEANLANQRAIDANKQFRDVAQQLRENKNKAQEAEKETNMLRGKLESLESSLRSSQNDLRSSHKDLCISQEELRASKEDLTRQNQKQQELNKKLAQSLEEKEKLIERLKAAERLPAHVPAGIPVEYTRPDKTITSADLAGAPARRTDVREGKTNKSPQTDTELLYQSLNDLSDQYEALKTSHQHLGPRVLASPVGTSTQVPSRVSPNQPAEARNLQEEIASILDTSEYIKSSIASALERSQLDNQTSEHRNPELAKSDLIELLKLNLERVQNMNDRIQELSKYDTLLSCNRLPIMSGNADSDEFIAVNPLAVPSTSVAQKSSTLRDSRDSSPNRRRQQQKQDLPNQNRGQRLGSPEVKQPSTEQVLLSREARKDVNVSPGKNYYVASPADGKSQTRYSYPTQAHTGQVGDVTQTVTPLNDQQVGRNREKIIISPIFYGSEQQLSGGQDVSIPGGQESSMPREQRRSMSRERERTIPREQGRSMSRERGRTISREQEESIPREQGISRSRERERTIPREQGRSMSREREKTIPREQGRSRSRERDRTTPREQERTMPREQDISWYSHVRTASPVSAEYLPPNSQEIVVNTWDVPAGTDQVSPSNRLTYYQTIGDGGRVVQHPEYYDGDASIHYRKSPEVLKPIQDAYSNRAHSHVPRQRGLDTHDRRPRSADVPRIPHTDAPIPPGMSTDDLPSTRGPLFAVSNLLNYEMLKKQNEESLAILSGLESRIQSRLDGFTSSKPLESTEWCTLTELKKACENLRKTLFAEKNHIMQFYIQEWPEPKPKKYEDLLRAYKRMESRYNWAKSQLLELMRATRLDEDLIEQMQKVRGILHASKENLKSKVFKPEMLRPGARSTPAL